MINQAVFMANEEEIFTTMANIADATEVLGGKWKFFIIFSLLRETKRPKDLKREVVGISDKVLSSCLKDLQVSGIVTRKVIESNLSVEYSLTPHGRSLKELIDVLERWGATHRKKIIEKSRSHVATM